MAAWLSLAATRIRAGAAKIVDDDCSSEHETNDIVKVNDDDESCRDQRGHTYEVDDEKSGGTNAALKFDPYLYVECLKRVEEEEDALISRLKQSKDGNQATTQDAVLIIALIEMLMELGAHDFAKKRYGQAISNFNRALTIIKHGEKESFERRSKTKLENLHTKVLYFLAQAHQIAGDAASSARSCAETLKRQLANAVAIPSEADTNQEVSSQCKTKTTDENERVNDDATTRQQHEPDYRSHLPEEFNACSWIDNCLRLAEYFLRDEKSFVTAAHCTAIATSVYQYYYEHQNVHYNEVVDEETNDEDKRAVCANIQLAWGKLCAVLLRQDEDHQSFKDEPRSQTRNQGIDANPRQQCDDFTESTIQNTPILCKDCLAIDFCDLDIIVFTPSPPPLPDILPQDSSLVADCLPLKIGMEDTSLARHVFNIGMSAFNRSLEYYTINSWATECCEIVIARNNLFIGGSRFEVDKHRKISLHRLRAKVRLFKSYCTLRYGRHELHRTAS